MGIKLEAGQTLTDIFPWEQHLKYHIADINAMPWSEMEPFVENGEREKPDAINEKLTVNFWFEKNDVENHPNGHQHFTPKAGLARFLIIPEGDDSKVL